MMSILSPTALRIFSKGTSARFEVRGGDVDAVGLFRGVIERPDLHGRDPFLEQLMRQFVGAVRESR